MQYNPASTTFTQYPSVTQNFVGTASAMILKKQDNILNNFTTTCSFNFQMEWMSTLTHHV